MSKKILTAMILSFLTFKVQAQFLISPSLYYSSNGLTKTSYTHSSLGKGTLKNKGVGYALNLKLGTSTSGFALGFLYSRQYVKFENETCPENWTTVCSASNYYRWSNYFGGFIEYTLIGSLSLGATYLNPIELKEKADGRTLSFALGYKIAPFIRLFIGYNFLIKPSWYDSNGNPNDLPYTTLPGLSLDKVEGENAFVGLEFPIES